jgi:hypothetical protein
VLARSWESLACIHGCVETWTLGGNVRCDIVGCRAPQSSEVVFFNLGSLEVKLGKDKLKDGVES